MGTVTPPRLMTIDAFSEHYGISVNTIRTWIRKGQAPTYAKVGGRIYFRPADIEAWIDARTVSA